MRKITFVIVAICVLIVGLLAGAFVGAQLRIFVPAQPPAAELLARAGHTFVASSPPPVNRLAGRAFYTAPKPFGGSWLCRVDVLHIAPWIVWNYPKPADKTFDDDIEIRRMYGVNGRPDREVSDQDYEHSCDNFRDFDHLIFSGDGDSPNRAVFVLHNIITAIQAKTNSFKIECTDRRWGFDHPRLCDGPKIVSELSLKSLNQTTNMSEAKSRDSTILIDALYFHLDQNSGGHPQTMTLEVKSEQVVGKQSIEEPDVRAVHVYLDTL